MPDSIRHPILLWIPAFAKMTTFGDLIAGLIIRYLERKKWYEMAKTLCFLFKRYVPGDRPRGLMPEGK
jgi:hypothetical protein